VVGHRHTDALVSLTVLLPDGNTAETYAGTTGFTSYADPARRRFRRTTTPAPLSQRDRSDGGRGSDRMTTWT
jgi:hypothetical protein